MPASKAIENLYLMVIVDLVDLRRRFSENEYEVGIQEDGDFILVIRHRDSGFEVRLAAQFFQRIGLEFIAPRWIVDHHAHLDEEIRSGAIND
jgi:hypothetical protein